MRMPSVLALPILLLALGMSAFGCAHTVVVEVPPKIDLQPYGTIGIVELASDSHDELRPAATQNFIHCIQDAQSRVRFLELGPQDRLLAELGHASLDIEAIRAIGKRYGVSSVFTGHFGISDLNPVVTVGPDLSSVRASAVVNMSMVAKHWETSSGATIWSGSRQGQWKVAGFDSGSKNMSFRMKVPEEQYGRYLEELAFAITGPFRPRHERRNVPK